MKNSIINQFIKIVKGEFSGGSASVKFHRSESALRDPSPAHQ